MRGEYRTGRMGESAALGDMGSLIADLGELRGELRESLGELGRLKVAQDVTEDWMLIPYRFVDIPSGSTAVLTRTIAGDGPFDLVEITFTAISSGGTVNDGFRFRIREGEAVGRTLTQDGEFTDAANAAGTAQRPYIIKGRRRYRANIAIVIEITNTFTSGQETNTIELVLHGIKVFTR
jgi:hypothetical protein